MDKSNEIIALTQRIEQLEHLLLGGSFEEKIRNVTFFAHDVLTLTTQTVSVTGGGGGNVVVPTSPDLFLRIYFKGKVYNIPVHKIA